MKDTFDPSLFEQQASQPATGGIQLNFKRVLGRALRYWYIIVAALAISLTIAYLVNRYSTPIYTVQASILIKENEENVGAKLLCSNRHCHTFALKFANTLIANFKFSDKTFKKSQGSTSSSSPPPYNCCCKEK